MQKNILFAISTFFALNLLTIPVNAQFVTDFHWTQTNVEVGVGESVQLPYTFSSNSMGTNAIFSDMSNWVFYEYIPSINMYGVVNSPTLFSIDGYGVIKGLKAGNAQIKPTGYILKASGYVERCTINVVSQKNEKESNNTFETANELGGVPVRFNLSTIVDQDFFKVKVNSKQRILFKIKGDDSRFSMFKWASYGPNYSQLGGGSLFLTNGVREIEIENWLIKALGEGYYYLQIYFDQSRSQYYTSSYMTIEVSLESDNPLDVNGDGSVDVGDVNTILAAILAGNHNAAYDVNGDGKVDVGDVNAILEVILKQ